MAITLDTYIPDELMYSSELGNLTYSTSDYDRLLLDVYRADDYTSLYTATLFLAEGVVTFYDLRSLIEQYMRDKEELEAGTAMTAGEVRTIHVTESVGDNVKYDLVGRLVESTGLTRRAIVEILTGIKPATFHQFRLNPEEFIIKVGNIINEVKALAVIKHIEYHKLEERFDSDIFTENILRGKLGVNAIESKKSLYDLVVVDSWNTERPFAEELERRDGIAEVYTKLPRGFYINTPMGHYNPDWAIVFKEGTVKHIYFVAETKGASKYLVKSSNISGIEGAKIECAKQHFSSISGSDVKYDVVRSFGELFDVITK